MEGIDPDTLLEWLQTGYGEERDLQLTALEQLCMLLLMSDNIDRCFESCPPRTFLPALCKIFLDETAPDNVLEVTARAITYYLDVSNECTRRITQVDGAVKAICGRLAVANLNDRSSKDLAEQCVKLLEHVCQRETLAVFEAGGLSAMLALVRNHASNVHKDTMHSAMSVITRLCGKMEPSDVNLPLCAESLGSLLSHDDTKVCECALRCFAALTDRFIRKNMDPVNLATHSDLVSQLLSRLASPPSANFVSIVLSLISNLCRGSTAVTAQVLSSPHLITGMRSVLTGKDERCVADALRLADLIMILLCEGRSALPQTAVSIPDAGGSGGAERTHRHLIDVIRQKDTAALIEAVDSGAVDVNYTDDVGQTLLNWASAFGSIEMVGYLCDKGADVNKGHKSSSLHYAASFGRPDVTKLLLQRGANPDLRDEDGKTALDKARERTDDDYSHVSAILECPSVYMQRPATGEETPKVDEDSSPEADSADLPDDSVIVHVISNLIPVFCEVSQKSPSHSVRRLSLNLLRKCVQHMAKQNDDERIHLRNQCEAIVGVVVTVCDQTEDLEAREQALLIMEALLEKDGETWVEEFIRLGVFDKVEAMAIEAETQPVKELCDREKSEEKEKTPVAVEVVEPSVSTEAVTIETKNNDTVEVQSGVPYRWREWKVVRGAESVFIWADPVAFEFSFSALGWFRCLMNGELKTHVGQQSEGASEADQNAFMKRFREANSAVPPKAQTKFICMIPSANKKVTVPGWEMFSLRPSELVLRSTRSSKHVLKINDDMPGFVFEVEDKKEKTVATAESILPDEFHTGWSSYSTCARSYRFRVCMQKRKVQNLALRIWNKHLKEARAKPREALVQLQKAAEHIKKAVDTLPPDMQSSNFPIDKLREFVSALNTFREAALDERKLSTFEVASSGMVSALTHMLLLVRDRPNAFLSEIFKETFSVDNALSALVTRMVRVLESGEKFPQYLYDTPGGSAFGLQLLSRRIRMKLEYLGKEGEEGSLLNRTGRVLKSEPLTSVGQLKAFLLKMVAKQWFDMPRTSFSFVKLIKEAKEKQEPITFDYSSDFDDKGIIYWLGTNGRVTTEWNNPASINVVVVTSSDTPRQPFGRPEDILSRDSNPLNCHTGDDKNANFTIDLGVFVHPSMYTLRHARGYGRSALRNWLLQGSIDGKVWEALVCHKNDTTLTDPGNTGSWSIPADAPKGPFRFFRIAQNGENSSGQTHYVSLSGFELYGQIMDVVETEIKTDKDDKDKKKAPAKADAKRRKAPLSSSSSSSRPPPSGAAKTEFVESLPGKQANNRLSFVSAEELLALKAKNNVRSIAVPPGPPPGRLRVTRRLRESAIHGAKVIRGPDWRWEEQDGGEGKEGKVVGGGEQGWVDVQWTSGYTNSYRYGAEGKFDVIRIEKEKRKTYRPDGPFSFGLTPFGLARKSTPNAATTSSVPTSSKTPTSTTSTIKASTSSTNAPPTAASTCIGKKSMSTTNLVDEGPTTSVSATGQAASAESLQHQTPSLENLLANYSRHSQMETVYDDLRETSEDAQSNDTLATILPSTTPTSTARSGSWQPESREETHEEGTNGPDPEGQDKNLSVSAPDLAVRSRPLTDTFDMIEHAFDEDDEGGHDDPDRLLRDEKSATSYSELFMDSLNNASDRSLLEKLRDVIGLDYSVENVLAADAPSSSQKGKKSVSGTLRNKMNSYTEVLKSMMQQVRMMDPSSSIMDGDDLDDEEMFEDDLDPNEDDMDDELSSPHIPVDSLASVLGKGNDFRDFRMNFRHLTQLMLGGQREKNSNSGKLPSALSLRQWDDELVLKCAFHALIPAFDPRPGRTNAKQTQDIQLPPVVNDIQSIIKKPNTQSADPVLRLFLSGPNLPNVENVCVELTDDDASLFVFLQKLVNAMHWPQGEKNRRLWEPTYTLSYEDGSAPTRASPTAVDEGPIIPENVAEVLDVLDLLSKVASLLPECELSPSLFISEKLTQKLTGELSDPLVVASNALPDWCPLLVYGYPCLFSTDTRNMYMQATAFGVSRAIVWLQTRRDAFLERARGGGNGSAWNGAASSASSARREDHYEFRVGRLKHERIRVNRCEDELLEQAIRVMRFHAERKAMLEIEYSGEEGTGLGPTLEFYALLAAEFQRKALAIWMCDDLDETQLKMEETELDLGEGKKPPGYYVRRATGLFPAPLPAQSTSSQRASELFRILGIFLAKVLQDGRLVDLPLSRPFLKLVVHPSVNNLDKPRLENVLDLDDLEDVHPVKGRFLKELSVLAQRKRTIEQNSALDGEAKRRKIDQLTLCINGTKCKVEDLALNFCVNPPSSVFDYEEMELIEGGADVDVTMENVELYVEKCSDFYLNSGIKDQVRAFREGFDRVFPLSSLRSFSSDEVQRLLSGEQYPEWTRHDVLTYTDPKLGYTRDSPAFLRFVDVLVGMSPPERKSFLQFATGCSSLPPGGLANLHPRLTIVRKVESGDGSYPSVNTCVHYLKLPDYSSAEILRERLLTATNEKGFHLN